jgi:hypothetical protein
MKDYEFEETLCIHRPITTIIFKAWGNHSFQQLHYSTKPMYRSSFNLYILLVCRGPGKLLPKTAEGCAASPRQFGGATAKMVANPYSTLYKPDFFEILMHT